MPLHEYQCEACGQRFELIQKFSDSPAETCRLCGKGPVLRLISSPAIQFKGTGWYITDYSQKGKSSGADTGAGAPDNKDGKDAKEGKEGKDARPAAKSDSATGEAAKPAASPASGSKSDASS